MPVNVTEHPKLLRLSVLVVAVRVNVAGVDSPGFRLVFCLFHERVK